MIARRLGIDLENSNLHNVVEDGSRSFMITAEPTFGKVRFMIDRASNLEYKYDIVFPSTWTTSNLQSSIAYFLGITDLNKYDIFPSDAIAVTDDRV